MGEVILNHKVKPVLLDSETVRADNMLPRWTAKAVYGKKCWWIFFN